MPASARSTRASSSSRATTPPARAARSGGSRARSTRVSTTSSPSRRRRRRSARSRISGASGATCRAAGTSRSSTAAGTAASSWSGWRASPRRPTGCAPYHCARSCPFEESLARSGVVVVKLWLAISRDEQLARFKLREKTPYKRFKITQEDWRNRDKWAAYERAVCDMVDRTSKALQTRSRPTTAGGHASASRTVAEAIEGAIERAKELTWWRTACTGAGQANADRLRQAQRRWGRSASGADRGGRLQGSTSPSGSGQHEGPTPGSRDQGRRATPRRRRRRRLRRGHGGGRSQHPPLTRSTMRRPGSFGWSHDRHRRRPDGPHRPELPDCFRRRPGRMVRRSAAPRYRSTPEDAGCAPSSCNTKGYCK